MRLLRLLDLWTSFGAPSVESGSSVHERCLLAVQTGIQSLDLRGLLSASVVVQELPWARDFLGANPKHALPGVIVSPWGSEQMDASQGTNLKDDVEYPVCISIVAANDQRLTAHLGRYLLWRQCMSRAFRNQPLSGVDEVLTCLVEPGQVVLPDAFLRGLYHSALLLRFVSRESRGT
jgi:hypothetical protein